MVDAGGIGGYPGGLGALHDRHWQQLRSHVDIADLADATDETVAHHSANGTGLPLGTAQGSENRLHCGPRQPLHIIQPVRDHAATSPSARSRNRRVRLAVMPQMVWPS